jgi:hypothetical protein
VEYLHYNVFSFSYRCHLCRIVSTIQVTRVPMPPLHDRSTCIQTRRSLQHGTNKNNATKDINYDNDNDDTSINTDLRPINTTAHVQLNLHCRQNHCRLGSPPFSSSIAFYWTPRPWRSISSTCVVAHVVAHASFHHQRTASSHSNSQQARVATLDESLSPYGCTAAS